jgi:hypothetical protein
MVFVRDSISIAELTRLAEGRFGDLVKAVVDIGRDVLVVDADMHADQEAALLADGAQQADLWGVNLYPAAAGTADFLEFDSMINIRPAGGNRSRGIDDPQVRARVAAVIAKRVRA